MSAGHSHHEPRHDVLRLSQLLAPATRIPLNKKIGDDMARFLAAASADTIIDPKALQLCNVTVPVGSPASPRRMKLNCHRKWQHEVIAALQSSMVAGPR